MQPSFAYAYLNAAMDFRVAQVVGIVKDLHVCIDLGIVHSLKITLGRELNRSLSLEPAESFVQESARRGFRRYLWQPMEYRVLLPSKAPLRQFRNRVHHRVAT